MFSRDTKLWGAYGYDGRGRHSDSQAEGGDGITCGGEAGAMKRIVVSTVLGVGVALAGMASSSSSSQPQVDLPDLGEVLARGFEVVTPESETVPLATLIGSGRPVLIEFWATWCTPCRRTLPHLVELYKQHAEDITIVGLTVQDPAKDQQKVRDFVSEQRVEFPIAFAPDGLFEYMNDRPDVAVPKLFVFDEFGELVTYIARYSPFTPAKVRQAVKKVLSDN
jgi:thiol-disulfide isomerase/thioredoxin